MHRDSLWKILAAYGIPTKVINIITNTYEGAKCCVRIDGETSEWFEVSTGVRQGCVWSPLLFGILIDWVLKHALDENAGIVLERRRSSRYRQYRLSDLDFADDIALIDDTEERLQPATSLLEDKGSKVGLTINSKKTKVMSVSKQECNINITLTNQDALENVQNLNYLGSTISRSGDMSPELNNRLGRAASTFSNLLPIMRQKSIRLSTNLNGRFKLNNGTKI